MEIEYRKLRPEDLDIFIRMRIDQLREEGATEDIDLTDSLRDYYERHMADGTFVSWLAMDGDSIVLGACVFSFPQPVRQNTSRTSSVTAIAASSA